MSVSPSPPSMADVEVRWISGLLTWQIPLTAIIGLLSLLTIVLFRTPPAFGGTAIVGVVLAVLLWAQMLLRRGKLGLASALVCSILVIIGPGGVLVIPLTAIYLVLQPLLAVVITLPTRSQRRFRLTALAAWVASVSTVALGAPRLRLLSTLTLLEYLLLIILTASLLGLILFLLAQYRTYLTEALRETRRSNVQLQQLHASLEGEVRAQNDALRVSEDRFQSFMDHIPAATWIADATGCLHYHNAAYPRHFLLPMTKLIGQPGAHLEIVTAVELAPVSAMLGATNTRAVLARAQRPDGSSGTFLVYTFPLANHGLLQLFGGVAVDITERARAEQLLAEREERFRALVQHGSDLIVVLDDAGKVIDVTPPVLTLLGFRTEQVLGTGIGQLVHPDDLPQAQSAFATLSTRPGESTRLTLRTFRADGAELWIDALVINLLQHPAVQGIVVNARDVTEQRLLTAQLQHAQKLEMVGRLAGGVAHDFNNILTAILGYTSMALSALPSNHEVHDDLVEVQKASERGVRLTGQLLAFARKHVLVPEPLDLNALILDLGAMLRRLIGEHITLHTIFAQRRVMVTADRGQLEQVLVNLAVNGRDAMPEGGTLTITTRTLTLDSSRQRHLGNLASGHYVLLTVQDTGVGMDEYVREHAFEPFFTTKSSGAGSGLGLAVCTNIITQHHGHISCTSSVGQGTTVQIYLPLTHCPVEVLTYGVPEQPPARGSETVLVVEDEAVVLTLVTRVLEGQGYTVLIAKDGIEALEQFAAHREAPIDLVLSDVMMPRLGGRQLVEQIRSTKQNLPILLMSGYTDSAITHEDDLGAGVAFLQKPFTPTALTRKVRELLDKAGRERS